MRHPRAYGHGLPLDARQCAWLAWSGWAADQWGPASWIIPVLCREYGMTRDKIAKGLRRARTAGLRERVSREVYEELRGARLSRAERVELMALDVTPYMMPQRRGQVRPAAKSRQLALIPEDDR